MHLLSPGLYIFYTHKLRKHVGCKGHFLLFTLNWFWHDENSEISSTNSHFQANNFFDVFCCFNYFLDFNIYIYINTITLSVTYIKSLCYPIKYSIKTVLTVLCSQLGTGNRKIRTTYSYMGLGISYKKIIPRKTE